MLSLRQMRYFIAIAECGVLARAAQRLNIAQSALSHHVAQLESDMGVALIERRPRGIVLTVAGQRLYQHAQSIIHSVEKAEEDIKTFSETLTGEIAVALTYTASMVVALPLMRATLATHPGVALTLYDGVSANVVNGLLAGQYDLAVAYNPVESVKIECRPLLDETMCLIGRADLIGAESTPIRFVDIPERPILGPHTSGALRAIIESHVLRARLKPSQLLKIESLIAMTKALEDGLGCSIMGKATVADSLAAGRLNARPIIEPRVNRTMYLMSLAERPMTKLFEAMRDLITKVVQDEIKSGRWPL